MATEDRRTCPIFRIERGTFEESHNRTLHVDYPTLSDEESFLLRATKFASSEGNSPLLSNSQNGNGSARDLHDDPSRSFTEHNNKSSRTRQRSLSDDYVFL